MISFTKTNFEGVYILNSKKFEDSRGNFNRLYSMSEFEQIGIKDPIQQINHSYTKEKGTVRGMHFQHPPRTEVKILRCLKGRIFDVIIDIRRNSSTFLKKFQIELTSNSYTSLVIPKGFAHGFQTLEDNVDLIYFHTEYYSKEHESGLSYLDPMLSIEWPLTPQNLSERDLSFQYITPEYQGLEIEM
jgi:dTDP-4-dehydrorhamnose 3,5-epimerase